MFDIQNDKAHVKVDFIPIDDVVQYINGEQKFSQSSHQLQHCTDLR